MYKTSISTVTPAVVSRLPENWLCNQLSLDKASGVSVGITLCSLSLRCYKWALLRSWLPSLSIYEFPKEREEEELFGANRESPVELELLSVTPPSLTYSIIIGCWGFLQLKLREPNFSFSKSFLYWRFGSCSFPLIHSDNVLHTGHIKG